MQKKILKISLILLVGFLLFSCGAGPGSPGSSGFENVGAYIDVVEAVHMDPSGEYGDVWQFDLIQDICDAGPPPEYEKWGDDFAILKFKASSYDPNFPGGTMYIKRYKVEFTPQNFNFGLPPVVEYDLTYSLAIEPDGDEVTGVFLVLRFGDKTEIVDAIDRGIFSPSEYPLTYDMKITFYGEDMYGNNFSFIWHRTIDLFNVYRC
jgi:hypothetical protein